MSTEDRAAQILADRIGLRLPGLHPGARLNLARKDLHTLKEAGLVIEEGWLPISSAPKDGTEVLLFLRAESPVDDDGYVLAYWWKGDTTGKSGWATVRHNGDFGTFTHWQPLPAPPEATP